MLIKRILILLPVIIFAVLLQSFFWVPTYDEQVKGNPHRLEEFITASSGDAKILNPILNADSASSNIVGQTFDGLIDRDENLKFRGRLATSWEIYEEAYFYVNSKALIKGRQLQPGEIKELILSNKDTLNNIKAVKFHLLCQYIRYYAICVTLIMRRAFPVFFVSIQCNILVRLPLPEYKRPRA